MSVVPIPALSDLATRRSTRREFLLQSSALGALAPVALSACTDDSGKPRTEGAEEGPSVGPPGGPVTAVRNADSKLDTGGHANIHQSTAHTGGASNLTFRRFDPALPPVSSERNLKLQFTAEEVPLKIADDVVISAWTFGGDIPGPVVHVREGDTVEFTLTNKGSIPHSMDFHAAQIDPKVAFRSAASNQAVSFTFRARFPGVYMYHCGTSPVLMHLGSGMVGAIVVDPPSPLPTAKEFVLVQSEYYLGAGKEGVQPFDYTKMLATLPDYVVFNGRPAQYMAEPIVAKVGDRVRFYVVNAGPTHPCNFHVVGEQFDTTYLGAPPAMALRGVQTFAVAPGGGMIFELLADVPGEFVFVNHGFGHGQKGAIGILSVQA
jgi:nitrite reductase (NO-forming)